MEQKESFFTKFKSVLGFIGALILGLITFSFLRNAKTQKVLDDNEEAMDKVKDIDVENAKIEAKIEHEAEYRDNLKKEMEKENDKTTDDKHSELKSRYSNDSSK